MNQKSFPRIVTVFDSPTGSKRESYYEAAIKECLSKILPENFFPTQEVDSLIVEDMKENFQNILPLLKTIPSEEQQENISFFMLSKYRPNAFKFFFEMFSRWIVPGKRLDVLLLYAADFRFPDFGDDVYTVCELMVRVSDPLDLPEIMCNLPIIEMEVRIGIDSSYHARRILEIKGLVADEKTAVIQEYIVYLVKRAPKLFNRDLFTEMQHLLVICSDEFKQARDSRLLSRIIGSHYIFRKDLLEAVARSPDKRHLRVRIFKSKIKKDGEDKSVLSVLVGLNFLKSKEIFEEQHLLTAIQNYLPNVKMIKGSFFANRRGSEHISTVYLEVEKIDFEKFSAYEIKILREELIVDLKDRIGHLMHPVFMPRNEEEIMRNVLSLSNQIRYIRDLPQVFISFDEQTHQFLYFNVIVVRVVIPGSLSIQEMFEKKSGFLEYIPDRCKMLGMLKKQYTKEATVFRVKMSSKHFLRLDHSIDLYKARKLVVDELAQVCGEFRDYNGGMISKQSELLCKVRELLTVEAIKFNELLLENFFYSLHPVIMRTVLEATALRDFFLMMLKTANKGLFSDEHYTFDVKRDPKFVFVMIATKEESIKKELAKGLKKMPRESAAVASSFLQVYEVPCIGYVYRCDDFASQELFCRTIALSLKDWEENQQQVQGL